MDSRKRKREQKEVDVEEARRGNILEATREELEQAMLAISEVGDKENPHRLHDAGVHRFLTDYGCTGSADRASGDCCFVECAWCYCEDVAIENARRDPDDSQVFYCLRCVEKAHRIAKQIPLE